MLQNIRIALVETSHTGSMGSVVYAAKTTGSTNLWLVDPLVKLDFQAIALAAGTNDVTGSVQIVDTLDEALAGCSLVVGISTRFRTLPWSMLDPRECGLRSAPETTDSPVALVFGCERIGLTNEELQKCHCHIIIAANPEYSSLNLVMAVQVISYGVRMVWPTMQESDKTIDYEEAEYPLVDDLERFYGYLEQTPLSTGSIREGRPGQVMNKLHHLFTRARPESQELNILRGILASIERQNKSK